ncbi:hypothetical protein CBOVI_04085 [Corynebacterium bovis DSM 20582 = CIP 54.80]|nr:hypothetical protein CBOVI_04085 [Corynebacterium bovis DSM 20582 = CIP 54.80]
MSLTDRSRTGAPRAYPGGMTASGDGWAIGVDGTRRWGTAGAAGLFLHTRDGDGDLVVLMQLRATWTNQGGTWAMPGGARDLDESAEEAALRETHEETGIDPADVTLEGTLVTARMPLDHVLRREPMSSREAAEVRQGLSAAALDTPGPTGVVHPGHGGSAVMGLDGNLWWEVPHRDVPDWTYTTVIASCDHPLDLAPTDESADLAWWPLDRVAELDLMPAFADSLPMVAELLRGPLDR